MNANMKSLEKYESVSQSPSVLFLYKPTKQWDENYCIKSCSNIINSSEFMDKK